ncbi:L-tyrosine 3-hydroxylase [Amycolatopsis jejuensis]|uniref:L-tyrosine 3-hydroxylase n=1 Tax=Amycolatopsis jejuensis TaxID=330084 RepID=UPI001FDFB06F|nr:L-tyrosine 3-hydroxylase [Amycolatopsis jejuensis]
MPDETTGNEPPAPEVPEYGIFGVHPVDPEPVFRYRWILGHQVSFALWRAMSGIIGDHESTVPGPAELDSLAAFVDGYSAALLYASTVPRPHYHSHVRRSMALQHPAFSGTWAPDYRPVGRLFRGKMRWQGGLSCAGLDAAMARNAATHDYLADHLVPNGRSLLRQSAHEAASTVSREKEALYDEFFLTVRRPVGRAEFVRQLRARVAEVGQDLACHGLYPNVGGQHHPVVSGPAGAALITLVPEVLRTLARAARFVAAPRLQGVGR